MTNAEYIARWLKSRGVTHVYELIGGMITFLLDAIYQHTDIRIVSMHHEQGAGFAAEGWARMTGIPGVAMATSGPGAINLLTAVGSCYFDSVPAVFITGQVNRHEQKGALEVRQQGFQETDIVAIARPITKKAWLVNEPEKLPSILEEAFGIALSGRPGPVLLDIPMDVQRYTATTAISSDSGGLTRTLATPAEGDAFLGRLREALRKAGRPLILAGGGVRSGRAEESFRRFVDQMRIPVVHSLMGADLLPYEHPGRIGMIGSYGNRWANLGLARSDLLLVLGSRLDIRQTGSDIDGFRGKRALFHIDCTSAEINNRVKGCDFLIDELRPFLEQASCALEDCNRPAWLKELLDLRSKWPDEAELQGGTGINPNEFFHHLSKAMRHVSAYVVDVGQHQMWAAQSLELAPGQRFLTSGGMGAMGFALPASIGAACAGNSVVVIAGDGGIQVNIQELQTIARNRLPVKIVVINNHCLGMVRQFQASYFGGRYQSTVWGYDSPSFVKVAEAYDLRASRISCQMEIESGLAMLCADPNEPFLLEVDLDMMTNVYPKLAFGRSFGEMEPMVKPKEMEGT